MEDSEREDRHRDWRLPPDSKDETYGDRLVRISRMGGEFLEKSGMAEEIRLRAQLMDGGTPQEMRRARAAWDAFQREKADRAGNSRRLTQAERLQEARMASEKSGVGERRGSNGRIRWEQANLKKKEKKEQTNRS